MSPEKSSKKDRLFRAEARMRKQLLSVSLAITDLIEIRKKLGDKIDLLEERRLSIERKEFLENGPSPTVEKKVKKRKTTKLMNEFEKALEMGL